jgi:hypothetical protein
MAALVCCVVVERLSTYDLALQCLLLSAQVGGRHVFDMDMSYTRVLHIKFAYRLLHK